MSRVYTSARRKFSHLSRSVFMAAAVLGTTQVADPRQYRGQQIPLNS